MNGVGRREPPARELMPPRVAASRGCCGRPPEKRGNPERREPEGKRAVGLALSGHASEQTPWDLQHAWGWPPTQELGGPRRSLSFLTEDGSEGSVCSGLGPLSSTRRSQLEEPDLGGGCGSGEPPLWQGCPPAPPSLAIPSLAPWPQVDPRGSALPPQPLASSTLLWAGDELGEGAQSWSRGGRMGGPPWTLPEPSAGASPGPSPQFGGSLSCPQPQRGSGVSGGRLRAPPFPGGLSSCSVPRWSPGDGDGPRAVAQHRPGAPCGAAVGSAGPEARAGGRGRSSSGDSSSGSECFVSAAETLEPSEAGGGPGAWHCRSPQPTAAAELEPCEAPSPSRAAARELPPASPPNTEQVQGEDGGGGLGAAPRCEGGSEAGGVGELLMRLQGCSLRGSPPPTPEPPRSLAGLAAGDATPQGLDPPRYRHITPRTKSRLQASAARLTASSSSSSLFDESLEMPRRPPRLRPPRGVPRDPLTTLGHCVTPGGKDAPSGDGEGTGSLEDTEILPRAPGSPLGTPGSSPTVLLLPGDHGHPHDSPPDARGSPGSSPTVLLLPGDHGHPHDSPPDARGSPGSSPTVLLLPGDHGHPHDSPTDARGSPHAAVSPNLRVLEGVSGRQDPSPLGTRQPLWPHGSFSRLPTPRLPGSTVVELGSPAVPLSPTGCSTHRSEEHLEDEERGQAPTERHSPGTEPTTSPEDATVQDRRACTAPPRPLSDEALRRRLRALGDDPGPVTELTRWLYLRRLEELARGSPGTTAGHSPELAAALQTGHVPDCTQDELVLARQFDRPDRSRHWREGLLKSSFNYLLLDPRTSRNLPLRSHRLSPAECFRTFVKAIFYVGKGTRTRPYRHLAEALSQHRAGTRKGCPKVRRILEIWASGQGVISVHCFQSTVPAEAYTREGCLVEALGLQTITNQRKGNCYGVAASWPAARRRRLGVHMLHRAMRIFLAEGERQLRPADIQGGR